MEGKVPGQEESRNGSKASRDIFEIINNRRSIRHFTDKPISDATLETILEAGIRAPFAAQLYSMTYTRNSEKIKKLKPIGVYPTTKVLIVFFVDSRKLFKIIQRKGYAYNYDDGILLWMGIQDATLVAANVILAAEALGLGSVLLGATPMKADLVSKIFNVPDRVFPVVALCLGYPDTSVETEVRPRFPLKFSTFEDAYHDLSESEIQECMKAMDEGFMTQGYYIKVLKKKVPLMQGKDNIRLDKYSWSEHISRKYSQRRRLKEDGLPKDEALLSIIKRHGFHVD